MTHPDGELAAKTWRQLRDCTAIALYYLRGQARDGYAPAQKILDRIEKILTEGSQETS